MPKETIIKRFDSPREFLEWASHAPCLWKGALGSRGNDIQSAQWTGTKDYEEAYALALYGWPEGLKMLSDQVKMAAQIPPPIHRNTRHYDVAGFYPHPGRATAGEPFNMVAPRAEEIKPKPIIHLRTHFGAPSDVSPETIMMWGASICSYINALEQAGRSVQWDAVSESTQSTYSSAPDISFQFPLKTAGQNLSMTSIVFWMTHPSALRRIEFSAMERLDIEQWYEDNYGQPATVTAPEPGTLYLTIKDAGNSLEQNLRVIRNKHLELLDHNDPIRAALPEFSR